MKSRNKLTGLFLALAVLSATAMTGRVLGADFEATILMDADPGTEIVVGQTVTIMADWSTTKDVTNFEWYVDVDPATDPVGGETPEIPDGERRAGEYTFDFTPTEAGTYVIYFRIWHHTRYDDGWDAWESITITVAEPQEGQWIRETAWGDGARYVAKGNWATYTSYVGTAKQVDLIAGQDMVAGTVDFSAPHDGLVTITITIDTSDGWRFYDDTENVKIQGYAAAPSGNPNPGSFATKGEGSGSSFSIDVPTSNFYGVHVDVERLYSGN